MQINENTLAGFFFHCKNLSQGLKTFEGPLDFNYRDPLGEGL